MYSAHPSTELNELFNHTPYQGVAPEKATFLFIGLDANYAPDIAYKPIFSKVVEYHTNGVDFWRKYGVHHPFMLPEYKGDGRYYHRSFAQIGFKPEHANLVSFIELLHLPTVGRNKLLITDLKLSHLERLNSAILEGKSRHIFMSSAVARLMRISHIFKWLPKNAIERVGDLGVLLNRHDKTIYSHLHFSVYGKFQQQKELEALSIRNLLESTVIDLHQPT